MFECSDRTEIETDKFSGYDKVITPEGNGGMDMFNIQYAVGERIAQLIILPYPKVEFEEVEELTQTERGDGGFGSTGK
jgi:dUTP pyrophosphatase